MQRTGEKYRCQEGKKTAKKKYIQNIKQEKSITEGKKEAASERERERKNKREREREREREKKKITFNDLSFFSLLLLLFSLFFLSSLLSTRYYIIFLSKTFCSHFAGGRGGCGEALLLSILFSYTWFCSSSSS